MQTFPQKSSFNLKKKIFHPFCKEINSANVLFMRQAKHGIRTESPLFTTNFID